MCHSCGDTSLKFPPCRPPHQRCPAELKGDGEGVSSRGGRAVWAVKGEEGGFKAERLDLSFNFDQRIGREENWMDGQ